MDAIRVVRCVVVRERIVARRIQVDAEAVRVCGVAHERVVARRIQVDAEAVVQVCGVAHERVVARRKQVDAVSGVPHVVIRNITVIYVTAEVYSSRIVCCPGHRKP